MKTRVLILVSLCFIWLCGCRAGGDVIRKDADLAASKVAENKLALSGANIEGLEDPLETRVVVKVGKDPNWSFFGEGNFFRGYIEKESTIPTYQLYLQTFVRYIDNAKYLSNEGLKELSVIRVGPNGKYDNTIINIDRPTLANWSTKATDVRLTSSVSSGHYDIQISDEDAKIFLNAMDSVASYLNKSNGASLKPKAPVK